MDSDAHLASILRACLAYQRSRLLGGFTRAHQLGGVQGGGAGMGSVPRESSNSTISMRLKQFAEVLS